MWKLKFLTTEWYVNFYNFDELYLCNFGMVNCYEYPVCETLDVLSSFGYK